MSKGAKIRWNKKPFFKHLLATDAFLGYFVDRVENGVKYVYVVRRRKADGSQRYLLFSEFVRPEEYM